MIIIHIQKIMDKKGLSPKDIAPYMNISERTIYRILRGQRCPDIVDLYYFSSVLGVDITELFTVIDDKEKGKKGNK